MTSAPSDEGSDPWNLIPRDELGLLSLDDVLAQVGRHPSRIEADDTILVAVRVAPVGFRAIMAHLAHENRLSYSRLAFLTAMHGVSRLELKRPIQLLRQSYESTRSAAMTSGDLDALGRLNQSMNHDFQHSQAFRTTLSVSKTTHARLADLAMVCGLTLTRVVVYAILESTLTLDNARKYRELLTNELAAFLRYVEYRNRVLRLGS